MALLSAAPVNATTSDIRMHRLASAAARLTGLAGHSQSGLSALELDRRQLDVSSASLQCAPASSGQAAYSQQG